MDVNNNAIYRQVLGGDFDGLAPELRMFHGIQGRARFDGRCRIESSRNLIGRLLCRLLNLPKESADAEFAFELEASPAGETWLRRFPGRAMRSLMQIENGQLIERIGPARLWFGMKVEAGKLEMTLTRFSVLGLDCPRSLMPVVWGNEHASDGKLHFDVGARLPMLGLLTAYRGFLLINRP